MKNELTMRIDTPYTLNFLIYLQNLYVNQKQLKEPLKFPYLSEKVRFSNDFELNFKQLWEEVSTILCKDDSNGLDLHFFNEENHVFYEKLFSPNADNLKVYKEIYTGFQVWWGSYAGCLAIERSVGDPSHQLYIELTNWLKKHDIEPKKQLNIHLIYDQCVFANTAVYSYYTVLSIIDIHTNDKDLVLKLQNCIR